MVSSWGTEGKHYKAAKEYQELLRQLLAKFPYRLDTNFAKMDRIVHPEVEAFKRRVYSMNMHGRTIQEWGRLLSSGSDDAIKTALQTHLGITDKDADQLVK